MTGIVNKPGPEKKLVKLAEELRAIGVESQFMEPQMQWDSAAKFDVGDYGTASVWSRELGGLKFTGSNVGAIRVTEEGQVDVKMGRLPGSTSVIVNRRYHFYYIIQVKSFPLTACKGEPKKGFFKSVLDYRWQGGELATTLNQDAELRKILIRAKAPAMEMKSNYIYTEGKRFPSKKLFQCVDAIASYIRKEA